MNCAGNASGSGSDCEGEEQEDPSSSLHVEADVSNAFAELNIANQVQSKADGEPVDELSSFRQQWQRELEGTPPNVAPKKEDCDTPDDASNEASQTEASIKEAQEKEYSDFEKARCFFLLAAELERAGCWYESIQNYKRALAINPDIELLLYQQDILEMVEEETPEEEEPVYIRSPNPSDDEEEMEEGEDLLTRIQRIQARKGVRCEPAVDIPGMHISYLPYEVLELIVRWVVSSELDAASLERLGATCRGMYLLARDMDIWRNICIRTWGVECGTPRLHGFTSWRQMFIARGRLQLHGCYISKTSYLRHGDTGFQDQQYQPWFLVQYYRYLRFFPEGLVLMLTTPDEPAVSVGLLKSRNMKPGHGVMIGHYRLRGDKVVIVMKKSNAEKKSTQTANTRFRSRRREPEQQEREQTFHIELELSSPSGRRNSRLSWRGYSVCTRRDQWSHFELCLNKFPPFAFSRVRHYTRETSAPLASVPTGTLASALVDGPYTQ